MKSTAVFLVIAACIGVLGCASSSRTAKQDPGYSTIVFVCEHGSVKSVMASEFFNRIAKEKGLRIHAVARGITPDNEVPLKIADQLKLDGFDVGHYQPEPLQSVDMQHAIRTVAIGVEIPGDSQRLDTWNDIPAASLDYSAARDRLMVRIEELIAEFQKTQAR